RRSIIRVLLGGYHLSSDASHQPCPCETSLIASPAATQSTSTTYFGTKCATSVIGCVRLPHIANGSGRAGRAYIPTVNQKGKPDACRVRGEGRLYKGTYPLLGHQRPSRPKPQRVNPI